MKIIIISIIFLSIFSIAYGADYQLTLTIKDQYLDNALIYIPKALDVPDTASQSEKIEAFRQALYAYGRKLYYKGAGLDKEKEAEISFNEAISLQESAKIEAESALTD